MAGNKEKDPMIYEETYRYLLRKVSSIEFDTCLYALLHTDWDGVVQSPLHRMAAGIGTTEKYLKHIIGKLSRPQSGMKRVLAPVRQTGGVFYRFNLGPVSNLHFDGKKDRYCKKYRFFYSSTFKRLPISAKQLLLMAAFRMSTEKSEEVMLEYREVLCDCGPLTKKGMLDAITAIQASGLEVTASFVSKVYTKQEAILFTFKPGTLDAYLENRTEREALRRTLFDQGFFGTLQDDVYCELESVGKYLFRSFTKDAGPNREELQKLARFIYTHSLKKLPRAFLLHLPLQQEPKQAAAYFSTVIYGEILDQMAKYAHQAASIGSLLDREHFHRQISEQALGHTVDYLELDRHTEPIRQRHLQAAFICEKLGRWSEEWLLSRLRGKENRDELLNLRNDTYDRFDHLITEANHFGSPVVPHSERTRYLAQKKDALQSYFSIQRDRPFTASPI